MVEDRHALLMLRFQSGDSGAFHELYEDYKFPLLNFIYRFCQDRRVAEELCQEVFIRVYKSASSYEAKAKFSTWLYRIATNICLNELRSGKYQYELVPSSLDKNEPGKEPLGFEDTDQARADDGMEARELNIAVRQAIAQLPKKQRLAVLFSIYQQLSYKDIGERIGCSEGAVKSMIHRSKIFIKKKLKKHLGD
ncbi:MAG: RNA polymerase sigma factor [Proteobacteria bacterium]|jgi:RNA polymerase sigma-70 factor (ECF subfamily)|nr:RNA polymerase sigma factor [Pseudomonadota bacterium]